MQPEFGGDGVALGIEIGGEHARSGAAGERGLHQADGALADDQHRVVGGQVEHLHALQDGVHRLDERPPAQRARRRESAPRRGIAAIQSITRMYSAKPPPEGSKPAVAPTFL